MHRCHGGTNQQWRLEDNGELKSYADNGQCVELHILTQSKKGGSVFHGLGLGPARGGDLDAWEV